MESSLSQQPCFTTNNEQGRYLLTLRSYTKKQAWTSIRTPPGLLISINSTENGDCHGAPWVLKRMALDQPRHGEQPRVLAGNSSQVGPRSGHCPFKRFHDVLTPFPNLYQILNAHNRFDMEWLSIRLSLQRKLNSLWSGHVPILWGQNIQLDRAVATFVRCGWEQCGESFRW